MFNPTDFKEKLVARCKYTLIGKFSNTIPKIELIKKQFVLQIKLKGRVKLTYYNVRHIYINLENEYDHSAIWSKGKMYIKGKLMRF